MSAGQTSPGGSITALFRAVGAHELWICELPHVWPKELIVARGGLQLINRSFEIRPDIHVIPQSCADQCERCCAMTRVRVSQDQPVLSACDDLLQQLPNVVDVDRDATVRRVGIQLIPVIGEIINGLWKSPFASALGTFRTFTVSIACRRSPYNLDPTICP